MTQHITASLLQRATDHGHVESLKSDSITLQVGQEKTRAMVADSLASSQIFRSYPRDWFVPTSARCYYWWFVFDRICLCTAFPVPSLEAMNALV